MAPSNNNESSSSHHSSSSSSTYEQTMANARESSLPDRVPWEPSMSYRNSPYRLLHHQRGVIGYVTVRLIEARDLTRRGGGCGGGIMGEEDEVEEEEVSSYGVFYLSSSSSSEDDDEEEVGNYGNNRNNDSNTGIPPQYQHLVSQVEGIGGGGGSEWNKKQMGRGNSSFDSSSKNTSSTDDDDDDDEEEAHTNKSNSAKKEIYRSSTIPQNTNPKWTSTRSDSSSFIIPLRKGSIQPEGSSVVLNVSMKEEETKLFGQVVRRNLGRGIVNLKPLLFGEEGILDVWIDLKRKKKGGGGGGGASFHEDGKPYAVAASASSAASSSSSYHQQRNDNTPSSTTTFGGGGGYYCGRVRLLVAYEPRGLHPREGDVACLESFARSSSNCIFHKPTTQPLKVLKTLGNHVLVQYRMAAAGAPGGGHSSVIDVEGRRDDEEKKKYHHLIYGKIRLHRNTLFIIERFHAMDVVVDKALQPIDYISNIPTVRHIGHVLNPYVGALGDLAMPAVLSGKLIFLAAKTTAGAGLSV